jgi:phage terminase large subunit-like protein
VPAGHVDDFVQELKRVGEVAFRKRHPTPVLIVTGRATRGTRAGTDEVTRVTSVAKSGKHRASLALVHRVFPLAKAANAPSGPVLVGRTSENDVSIPEYSISKRHCAFELRDGSMAVFDCGSTNGTLLNGTKIEAGASIPLCGGEIITMGRFTFVYETAAGFLEFVSGLVK